MAEAKKTSSKKIDVKELAHTLIRHEGKVNKVYKCSAGKFTIGVGRNIQDVGLTDDECMYLLQNDIDRCIAQAEKFEWFKKLTKNRKHVIVNMIFNIGLPRFKKFAKTIRYIEKGLYEKASKEMLDSRWAVQVGKRAVELSELMAKG